MNAISITAVATLLDGYQHPPARRFYTVLDYFNPDSPRVHY